MKKIIFKLSAWFAVIYLFASVPSGQATTLVHRNLASLVASADRIFVGRCVSVQEGELKFPSGSILYTEYTFQVLDRIKGNVVGEVKVRQLGLTKPRQINETTALVDRVVGMPVYRENGEYLLFLNKDSRLGLTTPVGLFQGAFSIARDENGRDFAVNGNFNRGLFKGMSPEKPAVAGLSVSEKSLLRKKKGPVHLDSLISLVRKLAQKN